MAVEDLFNKANKMFAEKNYLGGLEVYKEIFIKFPKNVRLFDEVKKKENKYKKPIFQSYSQLEIQEFFKLENIEHISKVIKKLTNNFSQNSNDVLTIALLGNLHGLNKDLNKAIYFQNLAIQKAPFEKVFYLNLSETLRKNDQLDKSLSILYFAKILSSNDILIDYKLAKLNTSIKNFTKADLIYDHLIRDKNINKDIVLGYCDNLIKSKKENQAISFIKKLKKNLLTDDIIYSVLGLAYFQKKEFDTAKKFLLNSISLNKNNSYPFTLLGDCFSATGDLENARKNYKRSLNIDPNNKMALNNLAALSFYNGDFFKAEKIYKLSVINNENNYDGLYYLAQCQLAQCDFVSGWKNFEYRWLANQFNSKKLISNLPKFKLYTESKNLLLWSEQGVGDQILFLRFLKNLEPHVNNLFITIDSRLHRIIKRISPKINFFNKEDFSKNANIDCQIPLGDLGSLFVKDNTDLIKYNNCYLTSDFDLKKELKDNLNIKNKFICGLSWFSKNDEIGANKSITLEKLKPILSMKNIEFIDLQYNDTIDERKKFYSESGIKISKIESIDNFNDLDGVTSLIDICDFVITVSNTNAHISGAIGKKTYLLLPKGKGKLWYWSADKNRSVWYDSIRIIEQKTTDIWDDPIIELKKIIEGKING